MVKKKGLSEADERAKSRSAAKGNKYSGFESVMNDLTSGRHDAPMQSGIFSAMGERKKRKKEEIW
jgi:hypothetical protein